MSVLAIDVGTGSTRAAVVDGAGRILAAVQEPSARHGPSDFLDPGVVWGSVARVAALAVAESGQSPAAVGVSSQLGWVAVGSDGTPLTPVMTWAHQLPKEAADLVRLLGDIGVYRVAGRRISGELPLCKWYWLRQEQPDVYRGAHRFLSLKDYLVYRLTGRMVTDTVHASYTGLFDVVRRRWSDQIAGGLGIDLAKLPEVLDPGDLAGPLSSEAATLLGLLRGVPVVVGGPDGTMAGVGAGVIAPGLAVDVLGTTDVFLTCVDRPIFDPAMGTILNCHPLPGHWMMGGTMGTTGGCLQWLVRQFGGGHAQDTLEALAAVIPPGSHGLVALTGLTGDRSPDWNPLARGALIGLTPDHSPAEAYRAVLEGTSFGLRAIAEAMGAAGVQPAEIRAIGGGARSDLALQIRADVLGVPIARPRDWEATTLGTAMNSLVAVGHYGDLQEACRQLVRVDRFVIPDPGHQPLYTARYHTYRAIVSALSCLWERVAVPSAPQS